jgi:hypothetical protein
MRADALLIRLILILLVFLPGIANADANDGQFMGYQLGSDYHRGANTQQRATTTGNLIVIAEQPIKPGNIAVVSLLTTPETLTIGHISASSWFKTEAEARAFGRQYVDLLRAKYPGWAFGREGMDADLRVVEVSLDRPPYNLWLRLNEDGHNDENMWRFSMTLSWLPDSEEALAWRDISRSQHITSREEGRKQLLEEADLRGL